MNHLIKSPKVRVVLLKFVEQIPNNFSILVRALFVLRFMLSMRERHESLLVVLELASFPLNHQVAILQILLVPEFPLLFLHSFPSLSFSLNQDVLQMSDPLPAFLLFVAPARVVLGEFVQAFDRVGDHFSPGFFALLRLLVDLLLLQPKVKCLLTFWPIQGAGFPFFQTLLAVFACS